MAKAQYEEWLTEEGLLQIGAWARDGLYNEQIAHNMGISRKTLAEWAKRYSAIGDALKVNRCVADIIIENAVFKKACGYNKTVIKHMKVKETKYDKSGRKVEREKLVPVEEEVHVPADSTAQIFWLKHRKPEVWGDSRETWLTDEESGVVEIPATAEQTEEFLEKVGGKDGE